MDPIEKKWQVYYVLQELKEASPDDADIFVGYKSFRVQPDFVDTHIRSLKNRRVIKVLRKIEGLGFNIQFLRADIFKKEYEVFKSANEARAHRYALKKYGGMLQIKRPGLLKLGMFESEFDQDTDIYQLAKFIIDNGISNSQNADEVWTSIKGGEPTKKQVADVRQIVYRLNSKIKKDFKIDKELFEYKGKQVRYKGADSS
ncbi:MAG: hypothetical protein AAB515_01545 [Patescibacteria group bacterium]